MLKLTTLLFTLVSVNIAHNNSAAVLNAGMSIHTRNCPKYRK